MTGVGNDRRSPPGPDGSWASSPAARSVMIGNRGRDTKPELALRSRLHAMGLRFRVDFAPLGTMRRRRADVVFTRARVAVFVDGCFWHGCPDHGTRPRANAEFWQAKLDRNCERDGDTDAQLAAAGWVSLRFWEHEDADDAARRVAMVVRARRPT